LALGLLFKSTEGWRKHEVAHGVDEEAVGHLSCSAQVPKARIGAAEFGPRQRIEKETES